VIRKSRAEIDRGLKTKAWERRSRLQRMEHPLCELCFAAGRITKATDVHHVKRRAAGGDLLGGDLVSLCHRHHSTITANGG
jgi:5-methylcytosine-specific restriction enzyme A